MTNGTLLTDEIKNWLRAHKRSFVADASYDGNSEMQSTNRGTDKYNLNLKIFYDVWAEQSSRMTISKETLPNEDSRWIYDCSVDLKKNFAEQYMNYLVQNYPFKFIDHDYKGFMENSATIREKWLFKYDSATTFSPCHLSVSRSKNFQTGITHFAIRIATGLTSLQSV